MQETFVYEEYEVIKTGRVAFLNTVSNKKIKKVEITPLNEYDGTWKKWVLENALYKIEEQDTNV